MNNTMKVHCKRWKTLTPVSTVGGVSKNNYGCACCDIAQWEWIFVAMCKMKNSDIGYEFIEANAGIIHREA